MGCKIELVFMDWLDESGESIYCTEAGIELTLGNFHIGTIFDGGIELDEDSATELQIALEAGFRPVFVILQTEEKKD